MSAEEARERFGTDAWRRVGVGNLRPSRGRGRPPDADTQQRILDKLEGVLSDEFRVPPDFAKPSTGARPWQSLRVGDYRVIVRYASETG